MFLSRHTFVLCSIMWQTKTACRKEKKGSIDKPPALWLMTQASVWFRMQLWLTFLEESFTDSILWLPGVLLYICTVLSKMGLLSPLTWVQYKWLPTDHKPYFCLPGKPKGSVNQWNHEKLKKKKSAFQWNSVVAGFITGLNFGSIEKLVILVSSVINFVWYLQCYDPPLPS